MCSESILVHMRNEYYTKTLNKTQFNDVEAPILFFLYTMYFSGVFLMHKYI